MEDPLSLGQVAEVKKKNIQAHSKSELIYAHILKSLSADYAPFKTTEMVPLAQYSGFLSPPAFKSFFSFFFPHPETVSSNSQVHTALLFSHQGTKIN